MGIRGRPHPTRTTLALPQSPTDRPCSFFATVSALRATMTTIPVVRTTHSRLTEELRENSPFGTNYSDHMFVADYCEGQWHDARIVPFGPMELSPALTA